MNPAPFIRGLPLRGSKQTTPPIPTTYRREVVAPTFVEAAPQYVEQYPANAIPPSYYIQPTIVPQPYGQPYPVYAIPAYFQPPLMSYNFHNYVKPKKSFFQPHPSPSRGHNTPLFVPPPGTLVGVGGGIYPDYSGFGQTVGYATAAAPAKKTAHELDESEDPEVAAEENRATVDVHMGVADLYQAIVSHFKNNPQCRVSWLNRLLAKVNVATEFLKGVKAFMLFQTRLVQTTPETGTLLIKAACRSGLPEQALDMLKDIYRVRIFPTLGGIHYLMINFSLRKQTKEVVETFQAAKLRRLQPNTRTFHILIRECVDNGLFEDAMKFAQECKELNIVPNRVTFNILMNGCRKINRPQDILELRSRMDQHNVEINDTTVKFTALAHMMLGDEQAAVKAFHEFPELKTKMEEFCGKFFELIEEEDAGQKKLVVDLLSAVDKQTPLPGSIKERMNTVETTKSDVEAAEKKMENLSV